MYRSAITLLVVALLVGVSSAQGQERIEIKCATVAPDGSTWMESLESLNKKLYRKTRGRVKFKFFPGGIAGEEKAVLEKMEYDQLQAAALTGTGLGEIVPESRILELPLTFRSYEEYDHVLERLGPDLDERFAQKGYVILGWSEGGFANFMSRDRVETFEELTESKCWVRAGDPVFELSMREMGSPTVPLALTDVLTSLQTGHVSTVYISPLACIALQWFPHLKYRHDIPIMNIPAALIVKKSVIDQLSERDREALLEICSEGFRELRDRTRADNEEAKKILTEKGIETLEVAPEDRARLDEVRDRIQAQLVGKLYDQGLLDRVQGYLEEFRNR